jgi:hypothetical protein
MPQVRLMRPAFINASYCNIGDVVTLADGVEMAPFMTPWPEPPAPAVAPRSHSVSVRYDEGARTLGITIDGVETNLDNADLKLRME